MDGVTPAEPGRIVLLNGAPRSGKSSIAAAMQERFDGVWINLGTDVYQQAVPRWLHPSIGLRPGGERPDIERHLPTLFAALYDSIAAHGRIGLNVVADVGHHDAYGEPLGLLARGLARLRGLPVLVVGVRCPLPVILERRGRDQEGRQGVYEQAGADGRVPAPVRAWQDEVHLPGLYDVEVDTSLLTPQECCDRIATALRAGCSGPTAIERIIGMADAVRNGSP